MKTFQKIFPMIWVFCTPLMPKAAEGDVVQPVYSWSGQELRLLDPVSYHPKSDSTRVLPPSADRDSFYSFHGERKVSHDGLVFSLPKFPSNSRVTIEAEVRGKGAVLMCTRVKDQWTYPADRSFQLGPDWGKRLISTVTGEEEDERKLYLITPPNVDLVTDCEVRSVKVRVEAVPSEGASLEKPIQYDAASYRNEKSLNEKRLIFEGMPVPQVHKAFFVFVHSADAGSSPEIRVASSRVGDHLVLSTLKPVEGLQGWHRSSPLNYAQVGETLKVEVSAKAPHSKHPKITKIVICPDDTLPPISRDP